MLIHSTQVPSAGFLLPSVRIGITLNPRPHKSPARSRRFEASAARLRLLQEEEGKLALRLVQQSEDDCHPFDATLDFRDKSAEFDLEIDLVLPQEFQPVASTGLGG